MEFSTTAQEILTILNLPIIDLECHHTFEIQIISKKKRSVQND